jgi:hypothetical protein
MLHHNTWSQMPCVMMMLMIPVCFLRGLLPGILALQFFLVFNSLGKLHTRSSRHNGPGAAASHHHYRGISLLDSASQHQNLNPRAPFDDADDHAYGSVSWWVCFLPFLHCKFFFLVFNSFGKLHTRSSRHKGPMLNPMITGAFHFFLMLYNINTWIQMHWVMIIMGLLPDGFCFLPLLDWNFLSSSILLENSQNI